MEIKPEADSNDTVECSENGNPCAGMFTVSDAVFFTFNCHLTCTSVCIVFLLLLFAL